MTNWKKIAVLGIVLVIFVAAFIFLSKMQNADNSDSNEDNQGKIAEVNSEDVSKIILEHEGTEIVLTREEIEVEKETTDENGETKTETEKKKVWTNPDFDVDSSRVDDIIRAAGTTINRTINENPENVSVYGLDNPRLVTFVLSDGKEVTLEIGGQSPTGESQYVRRAGEKAVYSIGSYDGKKLASGKFDIMDRNLYAKDDVSESDISTLAFFKNGDKVFEAVSDSESGTWNMISPLKVKAEMLEFNKFLKWISGMRASEFIAENPSDLSEYGLDKPTYEFSYTLDGETYRLILGSKTDNLYYAKMEDRPLIFTVNGSGLNFVDLPLIDLIQTFIYIPDIYDVERLVIEMDGRVDWLFIQANRENPDKDVFYFNGRRIEEEDKSLFRGYYQGAIGISGDMLYLDAKPSGKAEIRLTYTMKEAKPDKTVVVELIPTEDGYGYYLMRNGEYSGLVMGKRQLDDQYLGIRTFYKKLIEGLNKTD